MWICSSMPPYQRRVGWTAERDAESARIDLETLLPAGRRASGRRRDRRIRRGLVHIADGVVMIGVFPVATHRTIS